MVYAIGRSRWARWRSNSIPYGFAGPVMRRHSATPRLPRRRTFEPNDEVSNPGHELEDWLAAEKDVYALVADFIRQATLQAALNSQRAIRLDDVARQVRLEPDVGLRAHR